VKPTPRFELRRVPVSLDEFQRLAVTLEDVGVALYDGQAGNLTAGSLAAAAAILSVEARHAAWVRDLAGEEPAPVASDVPADATEVQARLTRAGVAVV
jgi:Ferritin-like domain